jgi:hypothetical protein
MKTKQEPIGIEIEFDFSAAMSATPEGAAEMINKLPVKYRKFIAYGLASDIQRAARAQAEQIMQGVKHS